MFVLSANHQQASIAFRGLLVIVFVVWLTSVITQYYLKDLPKKQDIAMQKAPNHLSIQSLSLPPLPKLALQKQTTSKQADPKITTPDSLIKAKSQPIVAEPLNATSATNKRQVEQVYQQLSASGIDIQLAWPQNSNERQTLFDFLYQCVGIQLAVLNGNDITQRSQTELADYSDWIRVAQGSLTSKEQNWLNAFALTGIPIRLFPRQVDWRLSDYLVNTLKGTQLSRLRATYQVSNQQLRLTNIQLNNQIVPASWVLFQGKCNTRI